MRYFVGFLSVVVLLPVIVIGGVIVFADQIQGAMHDYAQAGADRRAAAMQAGRSDLDKIEAALRAEIEKERQLLEIREMEQELERLQNIREVSPERQQRILDMVHADSGTPDQEEAEFLAKRREVYKLLEATP